MQFPLVSYFKFVCILSPQKQVQHLSQWSFHSCILAGSSHSQAGGRVSLCPHNLPTPSPSQPISQTELSLGTKSRMGRPDSVPPGGFPFFFFSMEVTVQRLPGKLPSHPSSHAAPHIPQVAFQEDNPWAQWQGTFSPVLAMPGPGHRGIPCIRGP